MPNRSEGRRAAVAVLVAVGCVIVGLAAAAGGDPAGASGTAGPVMITTSSLPDVAVYAKYKVTVSSDGGKKPYKWTVTGGALPAGVKLTKAGKLTGTPTTLGHYSFDVTVTDSSKPAPGTATATLTIDVGGMTVDARHVPGVAAVDKAYHGKLMTDGGKGAKKWSLSSGALPPGLKLTPSGVISGKPGLPGTFSFDVLATDSAKPVPDMAGGTVTIVIAG